MKTCLRKTNIILMLIICLDVACGLFAKGQANKFHFPTESVISFTDRSIYIAGETIYFSSIISLNDENDSPIQESQDFSTTIYVELITPAGEKIVGGKYIIENLVSSGSIDIPKNLITGYYYIKIYTKYMRNGNPNAYSYVPLKIINPSSNGLLTSSTDSSKSNRVEFCNKNTGVIFTIETDKQEYAKREKVMINLNKINNKSRVRGLCISVVPEASVDMNLVCVKNSNTIAEKLEYYPETQGVSLTGKLIDNNTKKGLPLKKVNLSIVGNERDFSTVATDSFGRFFFSFPKLIGARDVFLCTELLNDARPLILIDNDFCKANINLPVTAFKLNDAEREAAYNFAVNLQMEQYFKKFRPKDSTSKIYAPFYGSPTMVLVFDKYIQLPTIEDYITELLSFLKIRNNNGKKSLRIYSTIPEMQIYEPLILMDLVSIDDPNRILALNPQNISKIELVDVPYVKGNYIYAGIISFFSKNADYAGIDLPSSGIFLNFNFLADYKNFPNEDKLSANKPDTRNTLFWKSDINPDNKNELTFNTSDTPGKYVIIMRGLLDNKDAFYCTSSFLVK